MVPLESYHAAAILLVGCIVVLVYSLACPLLDGYAPRCQSMVGTRKVSNLRVGCVTLFMRFLTRVSDREAACVIFIRMVGFSYLIGLLVGCQTKKMLLLFFGTFFNLFCL